ncbi:nucleotidyltransferase family protein [Pontiella agarivorans]|uniref:Sugar phosphate nucleotidyltransferase n=1 Tax=Pontiella agarivorans TaxID=3038953 RepID=A0ABU5MU98_9BACT|nr:sugar phosphate nucleotidyltransferase [Pontiella agarivorans]MDZ8117727.1 sugar phosphate nucleotidyltransferase [Pontiella agarivorans]
MKPTLLIMAAGMGSRYGGLKQLDPVGPNGETLLEYSIYDAIQAGFGKVVFVIRHDFEDEFKKQIGSKFTDKIEVQYAFQSLENLPARFTVPEGRTKPWGTGQAVLAAKDLINEPFCVQNADDFYGAEAYQTIATGFQSLEKPESCMVGYRLKNTLSPHGSVSRGVCKIENGYLAEVNERTEIITNAAGTVQYIENGAATDMTGNEIVSMNFWGFAPEFFQTLEERFIEFLKVKGGELKSEWYIPDIVTRMMNNGETKIKILSSDAQWFGVTYPEDRPAVVKALKKMHDSGIYPPKLWG